MRANMREWLRDKSCRSVPPERTPISFGDGILRSKRYAAWREKMEAGDAARREQEDEKRARAVRACKAISPNR